MKVFLFGFSRGALIMRVFAEWLCQRGFPVEYLGLWDTVDSTVGINGEEYVTLPTNVRFARHAIADVTLSWILEPAVERGLRFDAGQWAPDKGRRPYVAHDSLKEPTNAWGALDPVKRILDGVKRHPLCDII